MHWIKRLIAFSFTALLAQSAISAELGTYYPVEPPAGTLSGDKIEVVEFFWYGCPHCYDLDPHVEEWLKTKPENVEFHHVPAPLNPRWEVHARFFYAAKLLGVLEKVHLPLFTAMHRDKQPIYDKEALIEFAGSQGVDKEQFRKAWSSFDVAVRVQQAKKLAIQYNVDSVPMMGVNGKFKTSVGSAGSFKNMFSVIDDLVAEEMTSANSSSTAPAAEQAPAQAM